MHVLIFCAVRLENAYIRTLKSVFWEFLPSTIWGAVLGIIVHLDPI